MASRRLWAVLVAGASTAIQAFAPAAPLALRTGAVSTAPKDSTAILRGQELNRHNDRTCAVTLRSGFYLSTLHRVKRMVVAMDASSDGAETTRNAEELKTGVQLRSPDMDKLCSWVTEEITLWLDQEWIERDVHREMGQQAAKSVKRMADSGDLGISSILFAVAEDLGAANFPRLFESDVNEWDVANKVSDLLLQSMNIELCCTAEPLTGRPVYGDVEGAANPTSGSLTPESSLDKYIFMQKALDGRVSVQELNAAVLLTLEYVTSLDSKALYYLRVIDDGAFACCHFQPAVVMRVCLAGRKIFSGWE